MGLRFENLDDETRKLMLAEVELDLKTGELNYSRYMRPIAKEPYPVLLKESVSKHNDDWLAAEIKTAELLEEKTSRTDKKTGKVIEQDVRHDAHIQFAEGEFNRFYIRALCVRTLAAGKKAVQVYRAKEAKEERPQSQALIGKEVDAAELLKDLRGNKAESIYKVPGGPGSGLSVRLT